MLQSTRGGTSCGKCSIGLVDCSRWVRSVHHPHKFKPVDSSKLVHRRSARVTACDEYHTMRDPSPPPPSATIVPSKNACNYVLNVTSQAHDAPPEHHSYSCAQTSSGVGPCLTMVGIFETCSIVCDSSQRVRGALRKFTASESTHAPHTSRAAWPRRPPALGEHSPALSFGYPTGPRLP